MKKLLFILFGFFVLISAIWLLSSWQSGNWRENLLQNVSPKLKAVEPEESNNYKEFTSPDGKFKMKYSDSWLTVENQGLFTAAAPKEWQEKYNLATIFLAQSFSTGKFAQLMVQKGVFDIPAEEIIEEMKKTNRKQELNMEIVKSNTKDDKAVFEARYLTANSPNLYSKEAILSVGEKTYLIAFIILEKDWPEFAQEADAILESIEVSL